MRLDKNSGVDNLPSAVCLQVCKASDLCAASSGLVSRGCLAALPDGVVLVDVEGSDGVVDPAALLAEVEAGRLWAAVERPGEEGMPTVAFRAEMALPNLELTGALASGFELFPLGAQVLSRLPDSAVLYQSGFLRRRLA